LVGMGDRLAQDQPPATTAPLGQFGIDLATPQPYERGAEALQSLNTTGTPAGKGMLDFRTPPLSPRQADDQKFGIPRQRETDDQKPVTVADAGTGTGAGTGTVADAGTGTSLSEKEARERYVREQQSIADNEKALDEAVNRTFGYQPEETQQWIRNNLDAVIGSGQYAGKKTFREVIALEGQKPDTASETPPPKKDGQVAVPQSSTQLPQREVGLGPGPQPRTYEPDKVAAVKAEVLRRMGLAGVTPDDAKAAAIAYLVTANDVYDPFMEGKQPGYEWGEFDMSVDTSQSGGNQDADAAAPAGEKSWQDAWLESQKNALEQQALNEARIHELNTAIADMNARLGAFQQGTAALGQFADNPSAFWAMQFADPRNAGQPVPVTPGVSSLLRQQGIQTTPLGARANAPIEGLTPAQVRDPGLFQDVINTLTSKDLANLGQPGSPVLPDLLAFGQMAGISPISAFGARMAQLPTQPTMSGSLFNTSGIA
jgi:hypothetical protein